MMINVFNKTAVSLIDVSLSAANMYDKRRNNRGYFQRHGYHSFPRPPFDIYMVEDYFPRVAPQNEIDFSLTQVIFFTSY